jgi:His/Glu/Gln/Arg/opine family amino acid ABC transporter permease subunit
MSVWDILINYHEAFLKGLLVTLQISSIIWGVGLVLGSLLGLAGSHFPKSVGFPSRSVSFVLGSVPLLVFLFWLHYPAQAVFEVVIDPFYTAAFTLTIINIFGVADIVRGALNDFPQQYLIAAKVTGLTHRQTVLQIQLPLILRQVLPPLLIQQVIMLHTTLFASLISVEEIFRGRAADQRPDLPPGRNLYRARCVLPRRVFASQCVCLLAKNPFYPRFVGAIKNEKSIVGVSLDDVRGSGICARRADGIYLRPRAANKDHSLRIRCVAAAYY